MKTESKAADPYLSSLNAHQILNKAQDVMFYTTGAYEPPHYGHLLVLLQAAQHYKETYPDITIKKLSYVPDAQSYLEGKEKRRQQERRKIQKMKEHPHAYLKSILLCTLFAAIACLSIVGIVLLATKMIVISSMFSLSSAHLLLGAYCLLSLLGFPMLGLLGRRLHSLYLPPRKILPIEDRIRIFEKMIDLFKKNPEHIEKYGELLDLITLEKYFKDHPTFLDHPDMPSVLLIKDQDGTLCPINPDTVTSVCVLGEDCFTRTRKQTYSAQENPQGRQRKAAVVVAAQVDVQPQSDQEGQANITFRSTEIRTESTRDRTVKAIDQLLPGYAAIISPYYPPASTVAVAPDRPASALPLSRPLNQSAATVAPDRPAPIPRSNDKKSHAKGPHRNSTYPSVTGKQTHQL